MVTGTLAKKTAQPAVSPTVKPSQPPPLETGDHLTRAEFERRYHEMPGVKKAELIEGIVYMPSPVRVKNHGKPHGKVMTWLGNYAAKASDVDFGDNITVRLDADNEPQPDAVLWVEESSGGRSRISEDDYLEGSPELIVEISSSTASYDLREKLNVYRRNGIQEYIVWRVYDEEIDWFSLQNEQYVLLQPDESGIIESRIFPGLRLNVAAMLNGDLAKVLADLQENINAEI